VPNVVYASKPYIPKLSANCSAVVEVTDMKWDIQNMMLKVKDSDIASMLPPEAQELQLIDLIRISGSTFTWFTSDNRGDRAGYTTVMGSYYQEWDCQLCGTTEELKAKWDQVWKQSNVGIPFASLKQTYSIVVPDRFSYRGVNVAPSVEAGLLNYPVDKMGMYSPLISSGSTVELFVPYYAKDTFDTFKASLNQYVNKLDVKISLTGDTAHPSVC